MCPGSSCQTVTCLTDEWAALLTAAPSGAGVHEGTSATMEPWHQLGLGLREGSSEYQEIGRGLRPQPPSPLASPSCTRSVLPSRRTEPPRIPLPALLFSWALALHALWAGLSPAGNHRLWYHSLCLLPQLSRRFGASSAHCLANTAGQEEGPCPPLGS